MSILSLHLNFHLMVCSYQIVSLPPKNKTQTHQSCVLSLFVTHWYLKPSQDYTMLHQNSYTSNFYVSKLRELFLHNR